MGNISNKDINVEVAYRIDRGFRGAKAGAGIGLILGTFGCLMFSRWLPDACFAPIVIVSSAFFAIIFGLFFPVELEYRELDDGRGSITPEERVNRLHTGKNNQR